MDFLKRCRTIHGNQQLRMGLFTLCSRVSNRNLRKTLSEYLETACHTDGYTNRVVNRVLDPRDVLPSRLLDLTSSDMHKREFKNYLLHNGNTDSFRLDN
jgi:hypothetical protein